MKPANPSTFPAWGNSRVEEAGGHVASPEQAQGNGRAGRVSPGFLCRSAGVTFQGPTGSCVPQQMRSGRPAAYPADGPQHRTPSVTLVTWSRCCEQPAAPGVHGCARMIDSRQIVPHLPERPDEGGAGSVLDRQGLRPCPSGTAASIRRPGPLHRPHVESGTPPGHDWKLFLGSRPAQVNGRLGLRSQASCDDSEKIERIRLNL